MSNLYLMSNCTTIKTMILFVLLVTRSHGNKEGVRIIGGYNCSIGENSYMISIVHEKSDELYFIGGGTLLSERWVLTARKQMTFCHIAKFYKVVAGANSPSEFGMMKKFKYVRSSIVERCYSGPKQTDIHMEIALLRLVQPIRKSEHVSYVRLAKKSDIGKKTLNNVCQPATIMGYGIQKFEPDKIPKIQYPQLHCARIPVTADASCITSNTSTKELGCLFGKNVSACYGDAGGPVMCNAIQYGVLSTTLRCGQEYPTPFIKVYNFHEFITKAMVSYKNKHQARNCNSNFLLDFFTMIFSCILYFINLSPILYYYEL